MVTGTNEQPVATGTENVRRTPLVAVCVATYRRNVMLARLLDGLESLVLPAGHDIELRIVDNDADEGARSMVEHYAARSRFPVRYTTQRERNIALTRNKALDLGEADLVAFIDDDEVPTDSWLVELIGALGTRFDLVVGDVVPHYGCTPPRWVEAGRFHYKSSGKVGEPIDWKGTRTSNSLLRGHWIYARGLRFDERFGRSGAEDTELFKRIYDEGGQFGAAPRSIVSERIHAEQCTTRWLTRRFWRNGINYERLIAEDNDRHPFVRFVARTGKAGAKLLAATPRLLTGRAEGTVRALTELSRAFGGLVGWLRPKSIERSKGYGSSGCAE